MAFHQPSPDITGNRSGDKTICELGVEDPCALKPSQMTFYKYYEDSLKSDLESARTNRLTAEMARKTSENTRSSKRCVLSKTEATYQEYLRIDYCLAAIFDQAATDLTLKVGLLDTKDNETLQAFEKTLTGIKDLKKKVGELKDVACKLKYCISDPCNSEQMKALGSLLSNQGDKPDFMTVIQGIQDDTDKVSRRVNRAFEFSVKIAGIHAFLNVASLKTLAAEFARAATAFKTDVAANVKSSGDEWKKAYEEYAQTMRLLNTREGEVRTAHWRQYSLCKTWDFVCDPDCDSGDAEEQINHICQCVEDEFTIDCGEPETQRPQHPYPERPERPNRPNRPNRPERPDRPNRNDRPDRTDRPDYDQTEKTDW